MARAGPWRWPQRLRRSRRWRVGSGSSSWLRSWVSPGSVTTRNVSLGNVTHVTSTEGNTTGRRTVGQDASPPSSILSGWQLSYIIPLIMAGKYATYSKWIQREIQIANQDYSKPIVGIRPWANEQVSSVVSNAADKLVAWNTSSIVSAIRELDP